MNFPLAKVEFMIFAIAAFIHSTTGEVYSKLMFDDSVCSQVVGNTNDTKVTLQNAHFTKGSCPDIFRYALKSHSIVVGPDKLVFVATFYYPYYAANYVISGELCVDESTFLEDEYSCMKLDGLRAGTCYELGFTDLSESSFVFGCYNRKGKKDVIISQWKKNK